MTVNSVWSRIQHQLPVAILNFVGKFEITSGVISSEEFSCEIHHSDRYSIMNVSLKHIIQSNIFRRFFSYRLFVRSIIVYYSYPDQPSAQIPCKLFFGTYYLYVQRNLCKIQYITEMLYNEYYSYTYQLNSKIPCQHIIQSNMFRGVLFYILFRHSILYITPAKC